MSWDDGTNGPYWAVLHTRRESISSREDPRPRVARDLLRGDRSPSTGSSAPRSVALRACVCVTVARVCALSPRRHPRPLLLPRPQASFRSFFPLSALYAPRSTPMLPATLWTLPLLFLSAFLTLVRAQGSVQSFFPASVPLAVRSPYMSAWAPSTNTSGHLSDTWPVFGLQSVRFSLAHHV